MCNHYSGGLLVPFATSTLYPLIVRLSSTFLLASTPINQRTYSISNIAMQAESFESGQLHYASDLRASIQRMIEPWRSTSDKPPYTIQQLVVMALATANVPQDHKDIFDWMYENFRYYRMLGRHSLWRNAGYLDPRMTDDENWQLFQEAKDLPRDIERVFKQYEVPLLRTDVADKKCYSIGNAEADIFLDCVLRSRKGLTKHSFFDLPAELRNTIYEHVFQYPMSGSFFRDPCPMERDIPGWPIHVHSRSLYGVFDHNDPEFPHCTSWASGNRCEDFPKSFRALKVKRIKDILEPLLTNTQFFKEAAPFFYSLNRFHFHRADEMTGRIQALAPNRWRYLTHVSFPLFVIKSEYCGFDREMILANQTLSKLTNLRKLDIWFHYRDGEVPGNLSCLWENPALPNLEEVRLYGPGPIVDKMLKVEHCDTGAIGNASNHSISRKRKAENELAEDSLRVKRIATVSRDFRWT